MSKFFHTGGYVGRGGGLREHEVPVVVPADVKAELQTLLDRFHEETGKHISVTVSEPGSEAERFVGIGDHVPTYKRSERRDPVTVEDYDRPPLKSSEVEWDEYLMGFAEHAATKSKDSTQVGAALVGPEGEVRLTAYNGPPKGVEDRPERFERPAKYLYASHAESNLIAFAAREGIRTKGCTVYVTHHPCSSCARTLIQAGIQCVVVGPGTTSMPDEEFAAAAVMFEEAGVETKRLPG